MEISHETYDGWYHRSVKNKKTLKPNFLFLMGNIAAMAESMAATSIDSQQADTNANAAADTAPNKAVISGASVTLDAPGEGASGVGVTAGGAGVGQSVGNSGHVLAYIGHAVEQVMSEHPALQSTLKHVYNSAGGGVAGMKAVKEWMNEHPEIKSHVDSSVKLQMKSDATSHPGVVGYEIGKTGSVGGPEHQERQDAALAAYYKKIEQTMMKPEMEEYNQEAYV